MTPHKTRRTKIFISYSHQDAAWLERLRVHLRPLERDFGADVWDDTRIQSGAKWREEIELALESARVAILLVSADFLGSDFIAGNELPSLLKAAEEEGAVILPIILNHSGFMRHEALSRFQAFNPPSKPLLDMPRGKQAAVLEKVAERVAELLGAPANVGQRKVKTGRPGRAKRLASKRKTEQASAEAARSQYVGGATTSYSPTQEGSPDTERSGSTKEQRVGYRLVIAALALGILAVSIVIAARQFGNRAEGMTSVKKPDLARTDAPPPQSDQDQAQSNAYRMALKRGGTAIAFEDGHGGLRIQLDQIRFDKGSNQYLVSFSLSSANFEVLQVIDTSVSSVRTFTYPANSKFKIQVLSAEENVADFSIEEMVN
jgi:hypothetical protein